MTISSVTAVLKNKFINKIANFSDFGLLVAFLLFSIIQQFFLNLITLVKILSSLQVL